MSGGKGGSQSTKIPEWVRGPSERNLGRAENAAEIGYTPYYGPSLAAFSPLQNQAFANLGAAGQAFGLAPEGEMFQPTMQPTDYGNGLRAHSSGDLYDLALAELQERRPGQFNAINSMFIDPVTGRLAATAPQQAGGGIPGMTDQGDGSGGGMWSDGMTASEVRQHQADRTFGNTSAPRPQTPEERYQEVYDAQMASYQRNPGISVSEVRGGPSSGGGGLFGGGLLGRLF